MRCTSTAAAHISLSGVSCYQEMQVLERQVTMVQQGLREALVQMVQMEVHVQGQMGQDLEAVQALRVVLAVPEQALVAAAVEAAAAVIIMEETFMRGKLEVREMALPVGALVGVEELQVAIPYLAVIIVHAMHMVSQVVPVLPALQVLLALEVQIIQ